MKKIILVGRYKQRVGDCHFEDTSHFLKMADLGEQNEQSAPVKICWVKENDVILLRSRILRWKMVKTMHKHIILAYRTSMEEEEFPCVYRIVPNIAIHEMVLKNVTSQYSKFERLKKWYDTQKNT